MTIRRPDPRGQDRDRSPERAREEAAVWVRPYLGVDAAAVQALVRRVLAEFELELDPRGVDRDLEDVEEAYRRGGGEFWVVEDAGGRVVGTCGVWPDPAGTGACELRKMYLEPELRGRGLGRRLLDLAIEHARAAGFRRVELETNRAMTAAIALYESAGFTDTGAAACAARCDRRFALDLALAVGSV